MRDCKGCKNTGDGDDDCDDHGHTGEDCTTRARATALPVQACGTRTRLSE